ncbi:MAG: hypothetical protein O2800_03140 [Planctomycetota bacterium]|nr:hypothetical protein [Planctomycetota bacterium]
MAAEPLIDLSTIDLQSTLIHPTGLDLILAQSGHMRMIDRVIYADTSRDILVGAKRIRSDEFWVAGHIPGRPLFPGVLMIECAAQSSSVYMVKYRNQSGFLGFIRCNNISFRGQVVPGDEFIVVTHLTSFNARRFVSANQGFVNGKLMFEAEITGMAI